MDVGRAAARERRSQQGLWLGVGLVALLLGYRVGLMLVALGAPDAWTPLYAVLTAAAIVAGFAFLRWARQGPRVV